MKVKYFIRGLGFGIAFTAILFIIFVGKPSKQSMSEEEIVKRATELGMVYKEGVNKEDLDKLSDDLDNKEKQENILDENENLSDSEDVNDNQALNDSNVEDSSDVLNKEENKEDISKENVADKKDSEDSGNTSDTVAISIAPGMTSSLVAELLEEKDIVDSAKNFDKYLKENDYQSKVRVGDYSIPKNSSYDEVVDKIISNR